jgi:hypothetical protein
MTPKKPKLLQPKQKNVQLGKQKKFELSLEERIAAIEKVLKTNGLLK